MRHGFMSLVLVTMLGATSGCVQMHPTRSGFLTDYSQLVQVDKKDRVRSNAVDAAALAQIDSFYIEPVEWLADDLGQPASSAANEEKLRTSLEVALAKELECIRPVVGEPGPGTARVRAAVTGVQESKPFANMFLAVQIAGPLFNGGAVAEVEVISPHGTQIAAESAAFHGWEWDALGYFWRPSHPKSALKRVAKQLASDLKAAPPLQASIEDRRQNAKQITDGDGAKADN